MVCVELMRAYSEAADGDETRVPWRCAGGRRRICRCRRLHLGRRRGARAGGTGPAGRGISIPRARRRRSSRWRCCGRRGPTLPFADTRDFDEQKKGLIAPMTEMKIMADAGHVAWDMERFQFLDQQEEFDSIHPSLHRMSRLNNNYGLYEVIPGIYQVRGFDLSDITFVRGKTGWIVFDPLVTAETVRAAWELFQEHVGEGLPVSAVIYSHTHADHWGGVRGDRRRGGRALGQGAAHRARRLHGLHDLRERLRRQRDEPAAVLPVRPAAAGRPARLCRPGPRPGRVGRRHRADRADPLRLGADRGVRGRRRADDLPEHAEHRGAAGDEHLHPRA